MSVDVIPIEMLLVKARRERDAALAGKAQAEDRAREWEETARRAEERAEELRNDRDGWAAMARKFFGPRLTYFDPDLSDRKVCEIGDLLHDLHGQGTDVNDDGLLAGLVNDWTGQ
ncbi:hypothetical protein [Glycomyces sp. NPDC021274]|uniref:hypothetical protein n=1 Tax=Glycomyces sp. NPDC021274 TaxID=3155120 RepID=UPI0033EF10FF